MSHGTLSTSTERRINVFPRSTDDASSLPSPATRTINVLPRRNDSPERLSTPLAPPTLQHIAERLSTPVQGDGDSDSRLENLSSKSSTSSFSRFRSIAFDNVSKGSTVALSSLHTIREEMSKYSNRSYALVMMDKYLAENVRKMKCMTMEFDSILIVVISCYFYPIRCRTGCATY